MGYACKFHFYDSYSQRLMQSLSAINNLYSNPHFELQACFLGATQLVARNQKKTDQAKAAKVHVSVSLGEPKDLGGFGLAVDIKVEGVDEEVLQAANEVRVHSCSTRLHANRYIQFCPYSRALKHGISVNVSRA
jgi:organic hydroperoxide reductase OsmC/OhrA